eukprot:gene22669-23896_t
MPTTVENSSFDGDGVARFQKFFVDGAKASAGKKGDSDRSAYETLDDPLSLRSVCPLLYDCTFPKSVIVELIHDASVYQQSKKMSNSKARFGTKANKSVSGAVVAGSKRNNAAAIVGSGGTAPTKGGPIQVIFGGKIVTPQSLISRKPGGHADRSKKGKTTSMAKQMTIDESALEAGEKVSALSSKLNLKSRMDLASDLGRSTHKLAAANRSKTEKEETFTVMLSETSTTIHLALTSFQVASDTRDVMVVDERNARYEAVIKSHTNVDGFASRSSQTKNNQLKNQNEMAAPNAFKDSGSQAISYEIKDEIAQLHAVEAETDVATSLGVGTETKVDDLQGLNASVKKYVLDTVGVALVTPGCLLDTTRAIKPPAP